ncbi:MAG: PqqD family protein [Gemmatimonadaceae bacterium]
MTSAALDAAQSLEDLQVTAEYRRAGEFVYRRVAGENLLIALRRDSVAPLFSLTETGAAIWQRLEDWTSAGALAESLSEQFEVGSASAMGDVQYFVEQLRELGALEERQVGEGA